MEHDIEPTAERLWDDVSGRLRDTLNETTYSTWFGEVTAGDLDDDALSLVVPNDFTREWIEGHFLGFVKAAARDAIARDIRVTLTVRQPGVVASEPPAAGEGVVPGDPFESRAQSTPKYTFDLFVIGSSNRFAHGRCESRATGRCTSPPPPRRGPSSSGCSGRRFSGSCPRP